MSKRDSKLLFTDILEAVEKINKYTSRLTYDTIIDDSKTLDAVKVMNASEWVVKNNS